MALSSLLRQAAAVQAEEVRRQLRAALLGLMLMLLAMLLALAGLAFLLLGAYQSLAAELPSWQAGGLVALGTLLVCVIMLSLAGRQGRRRSPPARRRGPPEQTERHSGRYATGAEHDAVEAGAAAGEMLRRHRPSGVELGIAALVAGLVASRVSRRD